jgi:hypothetical protein
MDQRKTEAGGETRPGQTGLAYQAAQTALAGGKEF